MKDITILTLIIGVFCTGLGAYLATLFKKESPRFVAIVLGIAAGVMLVISVFDMLAHALESGIGQIALVGIMSLGIIFVSLLHYFIDKRLHHDEDLAHYFNQDKKDNHALLIGGLVLIIGVALHNFPEGISIGAAYVSDGMVIANSSIAVALAIALHNIPFGMAQALTLLSSGMTKIKAIVFTSISALPLLVGAWLGYIIGDMGTLGLAVALSLAASIILYVVFVEIIPQAFKMDDSSYPSLALIGGLLLGLLLIH